MTNADLIADLTAKATTWLATANKSQQKFVLNNITSSNGLSEPDFIVLIFDFKNSVAKVYRVINGVIETYYITPCITVAVFINFITPLLWANGNYIYYAIDKSSYYAFV